MADTTPVEQRLVVFTERDCKVIVDALRSLREEHLLDASQYAHVTLLIARLS